MQPRRKHLVSPVNVDISGSSAASAALTVGKRYFLRSTVACYIKQGGSTITAAVTDWPLAAFEEYGPIVVDGAANKYIAAITDGASGKLRIWAEEVA